MMSLILDESEGVSRPTKWSPADAEKDGCFILTGGEAGQSVIILDYGRAVGGMPFIETKQVMSSGGPVELDIIFSETFEGLQKDTGDGPFFLFSNAMDTYRLHTQSLQPSSSPEFLQLLFAQRSQRYQKLILRTPSSSLTISSIGYSRIRPPNPTINTFSCSNEKLNRIWRDGVRTVDMCTVEAGETTDAWEVTNIGTRIRGQHWAPCRHGTRWGDKVVDFQVKIEKGGASWGVHMVANGLIFCLDVTKRSLGAFEGLSDTNGVFPSFPKGRWEIPAGVDLENWLSIQTIAKGCSVFVQINELEIGSIHNLDLHPILGGSGNNTGSVAFGGPSHYHSVFRLLQVANLEGEILYHNDLQTIDKARTLADFAVGTNALACTIDGAKRDRAVFGGDLFVMGRSMYYSTANFKAVLGSIKLLTSHQTKDGYLGNLCPIQAPVHEETSESPTYAFYSLSYALLLVVAIKDYWMHSGDDDLVIVVWGRLGNLMAFTERFVDERGLIVAPPPLSMDWFPMGGPIFGASGKINLAYYDALIAMSMMSNLSKPKTAFELRAATLKESILTHLWNREAGILRMSDITSPTGVCQDINSYGITTGVVPVHSKAKSILSAPEVSKDLPLAFQGIERWDEKKVVSPYATGFAAEALFERNHGPSAIELIERVWDLMADESNPNYSGGHWEAMKPDGTPITGDTSLMHGWSTWPVYLLPRYLGGVRPLEAGWKRWQAKPVLAGLSSIEVQLSVPDGMIKVSLKIHETRGTGEILVTVPHGTIADVCPPEGWLIATSEHIDKCVSLESQTFEGKDAEVSIRIFRASGGTDSAGVSGKSHRVETVEKVNSQVHSDPWSENGCFSWRSWIKRISGWFS